MMMDKAAIYLSSMPHFSFLPDQEIHKISQKIIAVGYDINRPVAEIMSSHRECHVFQAAHRLFQKFSPA